jgi:hypothetical protein
MRCQLHHSSAAAGSPLLAPNPHSASQDRANSNLIRISNARPRNHGLRTGCGNVIWTVTANAAKENSQCIDHAYPRCWQPVLDLLA